MLQSLSFAILKSTCTSLPSSPALHPICSHRSLCQRREGGPTDIGFPSSQILEHSSASFLPSDILSRESVAGKVNELSRLRLPCVTLLPHRLQKHAPFLQLTCTPTLEQHHQNYCLSLIQAGQTTPFRLRGILPWPSEVIHRRQDPKLTQHSLRCAHRAASHRQAQNDRLSAATTSCTLNFEDWPTFNSSHPNCHIRQSIDSHRSVCTILPGYSYV